MKDNKFLICSCDSLEHQMMFWYWPEEKTLYSEVHLITYDNFFKRLWYSLKYAFGHKSRFGAWDEFIFEKEQLEALRKFLDEQTIKL
jgi:hypothetical protein